MGERFVLSGYKFNSQTGRNSGNLCRGFNAGKDGNKGTRYKRKKENISINKVDEIIDTALKGIGIAMGIAVTVLSVLGELEINAAFTMLGIGLAGISISLLKDKTSEK